MRSQDVPIVEAIDALGRDWQLFKSAQAAELKSIRQRQDELEAASQGIQLSGGTADQAKRSALLRRWVKGGGRDSGVFAEYLAAGGGPAEGKGMTEAVPGEGGVTLPRTFSDALAERQRELQPLRQICRIEQTDSAFSEHRAVIATEHAAGEWVGESTSRSELAAPRFGTPSFPDGATSTIIKISEFLLEDSRWDLEQFVVASAAKTFSQMENAAFLTGTGTNQPNGILKSAPVATDDDASPLRAFGTLEFIPLAPGASPSGVITPDGLVDLIHGLRTPYWPNAKFAMSRRTAGYLRKLKDQDDRYLWEPSYQAGQPPTLMGFPVYLVDEMASIALNAIPVLFGDFAAAYLILEKQLRLTVDNVTAPGFVKLHIRRRVSGSLVDDTALKAGKCLAA